MPCLDNYLHRIYIVLGIISNLEMIWSTKEDADSMPFIQGTRVSYNFGIHSVGWGGILHGYQKMTVWRFPIWPICTLVTLSLIFWCDSFPGFRTLAHICWEILNCILKGLCALALELSLYASPSSPSIMPGKLYPT